MYIKFYLKYFHKFSRYTRLKYLYEKFENPFALSVKFWMNFPQRSFDNEFLIKYRIYRYFFQRSNIKFLHITLYTYTSE